MTRHYALIQHPSRVVRAGVDLVTRQGDGFVGTDRTAAPGQYVQPHTVLCLERQTRKQMQRELGTRSGRQWKRIRKALQRAQREEARRNG